MSRSWSKRHAPASPMAMPSATPQPQAQPQLHHEHQLQPQQPQQPGQPGQQLRRMTSLTQRFRSRKAVSPTAASAPEAHHPTTAQLCRRPAYVPTHAAASFTKTVSRRSTTRIDERDELACEEKPSKTGHGFGTRPTASTAAARGGHVRSNSHLSTTTTIADSHTTTSNGPTMIPLAASHHATRGKSHIDESPSDDDDDDDEDEDDDNDNDNDDYATFLSEAEANHRAFCSRWAQREKEREQQWASSNLASLPQSFKGTTQRDSAYYSVASASRSSMSGGGPRKHAAQGRWSAPVPGSTSPRAFSHKPTKTLGRRISEYFKPSSEAAMGTSV